MNEDVKVSKVFSRIVDLMLVRGITNINALPGCAEIKVDEQWEISVNGHSEPMKCRCGSEVPPYAAFIKFNGWPAGVLTPYGGIIAAGRLANEGALLDALGAAIAEAEGS